MSLFDKVLKRKLEDALVDKLITQGKNALDLLNIEGDLISEIEKRNPFIAKHGKDLPIDWKTQHNGVHRASFKQLKKSMPDVAKLITQDFPEDVEDFTWDVKVHMLMPNQFPCIPNWHFDNIPRVNNEQDWDQVRTDLPMYLWISNEPLTEFRDGGLITPRVWKRFTQKDEHRGTMSTDFQWRGFIRATHKDILPANESGSDVTRRHSQVYLDASNFSW